MVMSSVDHLSPAAAMLDQIRYAQEHIECDEGKYCKDDDDNSKDGDYKFCGDNNNEIASPPPCR
jgi:hypothetical protein